jgi:hypothetical protein
LFDQNLSPRILLAQAQREGAALLLFIRGARGHLADLALATRDKELRHYPVDVLLA